MRLARSCFAAAWLTVLVLAVLAMWQDGLGGVAVFFSDYAHPWRALFNTDLTLHVLLVIAWVIYREEAWLVGVLWALGIALCGGVVSFAYLWIAAGTAGGDVRALLLGRQRL